MVTEELLAEIGLSTKDISEFFRLEESKQYLAQERLLRKYRHTYLDDVHKREKLISQLDYVLYQMKKDHENQTSDGGKK